jgi:hypothetical protein
MSIRAESADDDAAHQHDQHDSSYTFLTSSKLSPFASDVAGDSPTECDYGSQG